MFVKSLAFHQLRVDALLDGRREIVQHAVHLVGNAVGCIDDGAEEGVQYKCDALVPSYQGKR